MKENYEVRSQFYLPRRGYQLLRLDGRAFHTYTREMERPFDSLLSSVMDETAAYLCKNITGAKFAYVQSDEISILVTDFDKLDTQAWFDGNIQKIVSISAAMATAEFNRLMYNAKPEYMNAGKVALFDSRVWMISDPYEVENVFLWRQQDAQRNSVSMAAQSMFSHKQLHGKNVAVMKQMMLDNGVNWDEEYPVGFRNGRCVVRKTVQEPVGVCRKSDCGKEEACAYSPCYKNELVTRSKWEIEPAPLFVENRAYLRDIMPLIPNYLNEVESEEESENIMKEHTVIDTKKKHVGLGRQLEKCRETVSQWSDVKKIASGVTDRHIAASKKARGKG